ncbi:DUF6708 domain-containing protein [Entomomonas asaccharolytica]|uniref:Uncharacterized protein n=2 Tax=Entomomonas asaccharolytica TaxID=2785331 RepID=A0A974NGQ8_9GAMM|nr:DUF6708 domain-containing protein [Entomomonas asaccharolytica]QQP86072.1 hypothetical protein JHT90_02110 [Entomomonas asaccharolytica]
MANTQVLIAGDYNKTPVTEYWCLAPLPIPTGYPAIPQQLDIKKATKTTLDHGKADYWNFEFGTRLSFTMCFVVFIDLLISHIAIIFASKASYGSLQRAFIYTFDGFLPYYIFGVGGTFLFMVVVAIYMYFKQASQVPLRFNREKRQVCAVVGKRVLITPWEQVSAQVESALLVTPYSATENSSLIIQLPDTEQGEVATFTMGYAVDALAIADWEAIRVFMEQGLDTLKQQAKTPEQLTPDALKKLEQNPQPTAEYYEKLTEQYQEGSIKYFYALKNLKKYQKNGYWFWIICHICSGWTIPCHVAEWLNRHPYIKRPAATIKWSQPIPQEQWAKPSEDLLKQTQTLTMAYGKKGVNNFQDYFVKQTIGK